SQPDCDGSLILGSKTVNVVAPHLAFGQQPTNTTAGQAISPAVTVRMENADNSLRTGSTDSITLTIENGPGSFTGGSTLTVSAVGGIAPFSNLHINTAGTYTIRATDDTTTSLGHVISSSFVITADVATHLDLVAPSSVTAGDSFDFTVTAL